MDEKKWTKRRIFLWAICLISLLAGWWYLSITTCAQLGGDDEIINLQNYYFTMHHTLPEVLLTEGKEILSHFLLQAGRFSPFSSPPQIGWTSYFLGDLVIYRLFILFWTYLDIALTALLVGKAARNTELGILCFCILPLMFSVCQDSTGNSLYSYGALVQSTWLPFLLAGLCMLRRQSTGHRRWSVLAAYCAFLACGTYEIAFVYIVPLFGIFWLASGTARKAVRMSGPILVGELTALGFYMGARFVNSLRVAGVVEGASSNLEGVSLSLDLWAILRTWIMQISAGFPLNALIASKTYPGNIEISDLVCGGILAVAVLASLAVCHQYVSNKEGVLLFLTGLSLLTAPALLIAISPKYQKAGNVDWRHGYIPQTVESFGVGLMALALLLVLLPRIRKKKWWPQWRVAASLVLAVGIAGSVIWQRSATRTAYAGGGRDYTVFGEAVAAGIAKPAGTQDPVVCDFMIWGGNLTAQKAFFQRYADTDTNAHALQIWRNETHEEDTVYRLGICRGENRHYDAVWFALGADEKLDTVMEITVYLPKQLSSDAVLHYSTRDDDGTEVEYSVLIAELHPEDAGDGACWVEIKTEDPVVGDSIRLAKN